MPGKKKCKKEKKKSHLVKPKKKNFEEKKKSKTNKPFQQILRKKKEKREELNKILWVPFLDRMDPGSLRRGQSRFQVNRAWLTAALLDLYKLTCTQNKSER